MERGEPSRTWGEARFFAVDEVPRFDDERVGLWPGLFSKMLPKCLAVDWPNHRLVVHIDCDLYSSTLCVLTMLDRLLAPGSILLFDETVPRHVSLNLNAEIRQPLIWRQKEPAVSGCGTTSGG